MRAAEQRQIGRFNIRRLGQDVFRKIDMNDTGHAGLGRLESITHQSARVLRLGQLSLPLGKLAVNSHDIELVPDIPVQPESIHVGRHHQQRYCIFLR